MRKRCLFNITDQRLQNPFPFQKTNCLIQDYLCLVQGYGDIYRRVLACGIVFGLADFKRYSGAGALWLDKDFSPSDYPYVAHSPA
jgi:hypothetical protein